MAGNNLVGVPLDSQGNVESVYVPIAGLQQRPEYTSQVPYQGQSAQGQTYKPLYDDTSLAEYRRMAVTDPWKLYTVQRDLAAAGFMPLARTSGAYSDEFEKGMAKAMTEANASMGASVRNIIDQHIIGQAGAAKVSGSGSKGGSGSGSSTSTNVSKSYQITSRPTAQSLLQQTLAKELGREPMPWEVDRFLTSLNKEERANPGISRSTTHSSASGSSTTSTSTPSSVDPGAKAESFARTINPSESLMNRDRAYYDVIAQMVGGL